jgi:hypothetical protein
MPVTNDFTLCRRDNEDNEDGKDDGGDDDLACPLGWCEGLQDVPGVHTSVSLLGLALGSIIIDWQLMHAASVVNVGMQHV